MRSLGRGHGRLFPKEARSQDRIHILACVDTKETGLGGLGAEGLMKIWLVSDTES